jgi:hypothetical protein
MVTVALYVKEEPVLPGTSVNAPEAGETLSQFCGWFVATLDENAMTESMWLGLWTFKITVCVTVPPPIGALIVKFAGEAQNELPVPPPPARRLMGTVCELLPREAITVALWLLAMEAAAVALKVAVVAPAATVTEAGTMSEVLLLASVTLDPPAGAVCVSVTEHVLTALCPRVAGLQATPETDPGANRLIVAVRELLPSVAVTVAVWLLGIEVDAVALKVVVKAPPATVTDAGTVSDVLLLASVTFDPAAGAVCVSVTVQVLTALCPRLVGLQARVETRTGASRLIVAACELLPRVAVTVAVWLLAIEAAAVALNVAVVAPAATVTDAGTVSEALLLASVTLVPPAGAVCVSVTEHVLTALCPRVAGLQATPETDPGTSRLIVAVSELLPKVAVMVAVWLLAIKAAAVALKFAVVAPAATVTEAGIVSEVLLLDSVTVDPPVGAVCVSVTVHALTALCPRVVGAQARVETKTGASRLMVAVCELLPRFAVTVEVWLLAMEAAAVALNVAVVAPAATVTEAGTASEALLLARVTLDPPVGAALFNITVQLAAELALRFPGLHVRDETVGTMMVPFAPADTGSASPVASTPIGFVIATAVVTAFAARVSWTLATIPVAIVLVFTPVSRQVNEPDAEAQYMVLPAAVAAGPVPAEIAEIWLAG